MFSRIFTHDIFEILDWNFIKLNAMTHLAEPSVLNYSSVHIDTAILDRLIGFQVENVSSHRKGFTNLILKITSSTDSPNNIGCLPQWLLYFEISEAPISLVILRHGWVNHDALTWSMVKFIMLIGKIKSTFYHNFDVVDMMNYEYNF